jgi:abortive infection bacteriophage resistance protein
MANNTPYSINGQISLLKQYGILFYNEQTVYKISNNNSYYRLKGYCWDLQEDFKSLAKESNMEPNEYFEQVNFE